MWSIAKKFNTTVDELKRINNLSSNLLSIGQVLIIPGNSGNMNTINYTVQRGDTLYKIANRFNTTVYDIMKLNNLSSNLLSIGEILLIPSGEVIDNNESNIYEVKSGDTLYKIANRYNTTVSDIINKNGLTSTILSVGQMLLI